MFFYIVYVQHAFKLDHLCNLKSSLKVLQLVQVYVAKMLHITFSLDYRYPTHSRPHYLARRQGLDAVGLGHVLRT